MILVIARAQARPDQRSALVPLLVEAARRARTEQGCTSYAFSADLEDPNSFLSVETWEERADLDRHMATPELAELLGALGPLVTGEPTITVHEVSSSGAYGA
ncbi:Quinol monooxygenase YgiN [Klenkia soli]|uniref:Quinol monooxygenase YgiN n=1 Tax=Klenkia soli TaxID=1052260 RepID=A0A1H0NK54_9ACTN|nr:putative quinol monooxygenase [Klenkia soli]SDO93074.1 Quinol monooxygenase YgiN [Klenkia soli]